MCLAALLGGLAGLGAQAWADPLRDLESIIQDGQRQCLLGCAGNSVCEYKCKKVLDMNNPEVRKAAMALKAGDQSKFIAARQRIIVSMPVQGNDQITDSVTSGAGGGAKQRENSQITDSVTSGAPLKGAAKHTATKLDQLWLRYNHSK